MKLVLASQNKSKALEFNRILAPLNINVLPVGEVLDSFDVVENGTTFQENARIKARALRELCSNMAVIADDSGLCVDYLGGAPGVYSARYSGKGDTANNELVLKNLENVPMLDRTARFVAAICLIFEDGRLLEVEATCEGKIALEPRGENGFGYDSIFLVGDKTMAELSDTDKDIISHRGKALRLLYQKLVEH